ncbi:MAG: PIG-L family deacetylase [Terriglobia bacterium]
MRSQNKPMLAALGLLFLIMIPGITAYAFSPGDVSIAATPNARPLPASRGAAAVWQTLLKLHTRASLIMITAHPDDEDGGMLAYESRGQGARVALLTLNRGESGQNLMSPDYFDAMGLLRTEELLAADRYYGVQQFWTRVVDFGFSKTMQQTLDEWGLQRVLYDAVRVVRMTRPLVVTSVFVGGHTDGHGNHEVAGEVAQLVYKMAGDPSAFPDQVKAGLRPWTPLKDYARAPSFRASSKGIYDYADRHYYPVRFFNYIENRWEPGMLSANVEVPEGDYSPLLGLSYHQLATVGYGFHKSQNGGTGFPPAGQAMSAYHRFASRVQTPDHEQSFFDGIDTSLAGIADLAKGQDSNFLKQGLTRINSLVEQAMKQFSAEHPEEIAPILANGLKATNTLMDQVAASNLTSDAKYNVKHELKVKQAQFNTGIAAALGLTLIATVAPPPASAGGGRRSAPPSFQVAIPGQHFWVKVHVANQSPAPVSVNRIWLASPYGGDWGATAQGSATGPLAEDKGANVSFNVAAPGNAAYTRPYFTRPDIEQPYYDILNSKYLSLSFAPYPLSAWAEFEYQSVPVKIGQVVQSVERVTGPGTVLNPLVAGPAISLWISPHAGIVPLGRKSFDVTTLVHSNVKGPAQGRVRLNLPPGWKSDPASAGFSTARDGEDEALTFRVIPSQLQKRRYKLTAVAQYNGQEYREGYRTVGYAGLRPYYLYRAAEYQATGVNVKVAPGLTVGYIAGTGDSVPQSLVNLGIQAHMLTAGDLAGGDLGNYSVILVGQRAYDVRDDLRAYNARLLDYVKNGGVEIVQYQSPEYDHNYGPFPYSLSNNPEVVMDVRSQIIFLNPKSPVLTWPNLITAQDFAGWVEERGHGFMKSWDTHYEALLSTHDPDQAPQNGGLLVAKYGKGIYVYCAYAFYRELPEGVPGAYRLFANLLSMAKSPGTPAP